MNFNKPTRLVIADDHPLYRYGFRALVKGIKTLDLIGEASNGEELLAVVKEKKPDVVITDISMPVMDGLEATRKIKTMFPHIKVIALSVHDEKYLIFDIMHAGASGYLLKNVKSEELVKAINTVMEGRLFFCAVSSEKLSEKIKDSKELVEVPEFSRREKDLLRLFGRGLTTKQVAKELGITVRTVESHRAKLKQKLGLENIAQILVYAKEHGFA